MRVLHLTTEFPPIIYGGLGTAVGGWVEGSARSGVDVGVLLIEGPLADEEGNLSYGRPRPQASGHGGITERGGITFFQATSRDAVSAGLQAVERWQPGKTTWKIVDQNSAHHYREHAEQIEAWRAERGL